MSDLTPGLRRQLDTLVTEKRCQRDVCRLKSSCWRWDIYIDVVKTPRLHVVEVDFRKIKFIRRRGYLNNPHFSTFCFIVS